MKCHIFSLLFTKLGGGDCPPGPDGPANSQFCRGRRQQDLQNPPPVAHQAGAAIIQQ